jgi:hypothetical protein
VETGYLDEDNIKLSLKETGLESVPVVSLQGGSNEFFAYTGTRNLMNS